MLAGKYSERDVAYVSGKVVPAVVRFFDAGMLEVEFGPLTMSRRRNGRIIISETDDQHPSFGGRWLPLVFDTLQAEPLRDGRTYVPELVTRLRFYAGDVTPLSVGQSAQAAVEEFFRSSALSADPGIVFLMVHRTRR